MQQQDWDCPIRQPFVYPFPDCNNDTNTLPYAYVNLHFNRYPDSNGYKNANSHKNIYPYDHIYALDHPQPYDQPHSDD